MTISSTNSQVTQSLKQRIDNVFDVNPKIKIQKLEYGMIKVNNMLIQSDYDGWHVKDEWFFRRKSAGGYAICLIKNETAKAKRIKELDSTLEKTEENTEKMINLEKIQKESNDKINNLLEIIDMKNEKIEKMENELNNLLDKLRYKNLI